MLGFISLLGNKYLYIGLISIAIISIIIAGKYYIEEKDRKIVELSLSVNTLNENLKTVTSSLEEYKKDAEYVRIKTIKTENDINDIRKKYKEITYRYNEKELIKQTVSNIGSVRTEINENINQSLKNLQKITEISNGDDKQ